MTPEEYTDLITIAGMSPGSVAVNAATFSGIQIAGAGGAVAATVGCILPPCMIVIVCAVLYSRFGALPVIQGVFKGLFPVVAALITMAGLSVIISAFWNGNGISSDISDLNIIPVILFAAALFALKQKRFKTRPAHVMLGGGILSGMLYFMGNM
jgi:chromate transporter